VSNEVTVSTACTGSAPRSERATLCAAGRVLTHERDNCPTREAVKLGIEKLAAGEAVPQSGDDVSTGVEVNPSVRGDLIDDLKYDTWERPWI
jgi:hypothetical protein